MDRAKIRQRGLFMLYNLAAFTLIFALFAFILYSQIVQSLYAPVHEDMEQARAAILSIEGFVEDELSFQFQPKENGQGFLPPQQFQEEMGGQAPKEPPEPGPGGDSPPREEEHRMRTRVSLRYQVVIRNGDGEVLNAHVLGRIYWENVMDQIPFSLDQLGAVTIFHLDDGSVYHCLAFPIAGDGETYYVQLLANVDGEQAIIDNFVRILVIFVAVFVLLSISASYFLSKMSMAPLLKSWERQTEFVANASHELRTPLTIIQNKMESLLTAPADTVLERADDIAVSLSETRRLSKLTSDLMTLARADSNATQLEKEEFPLDDLVRQVSEPYGELAELEEKRLTMELHFSGSITADRGRIHELMVILLDNALKYTRTGDAIVVRTRSREGRPVIEVADTGIGIRAESAERIFDRFYREDKARTRESGGSGLGLSIARWIVETHGGSIRAMPNHPAGTVMQVRL